MSFLLKIVEGPNKGAEAALVEGVAVTMGKGDTCDIVLADMSLPDSPVKIETFADGVSIDGEVLEPLHVRTIGDTSFAVGPAERAWGKLVWPQVEKVEEAPAEPAPPKADEPEKAPTTKKKSHGCLLSFLVFVVLAGILAGLGWYFRDWLEPYVEPYRPYAATAWHWTKDRAGIAYCWCRDLCASESEGDVDAGDEPEKESDPAELIAEIALRYGLDISEVDGRLALIGNLKTRAERLSATAEAYEALPCVELSLSDDETLKTAVEDTLSLIGESGLRVRAVTNRVAVLDGKCSNLSMVMMQIAQEVPKIRQIDGDSLQQTMVIQNPPAHEPGAEVQAVAAEPQVPRAAIPALPVCGILTVPYPCLVTRSGARILEGATVGEWTVRKINADSVVLENSTGRLTWRP